MPQYERRDVPSQLHGRIPSRFLFDKFIVHWTRLDEKGLAEPFFHQTIERLRRTGQHDVIATSISVLLRIKEEIRPNGFIFHISRCGSTLLANAMRCFAGSTVVSESKLISKALLLQHDLIRFTGEAVAREDLLRGLVRSYGRRQTEQDTSLIFKLSSWNITHIDVFRHLWPDVPIAIVIRDPLEVAVSLMKGPPGWLAESRFDELVRSDIRSHVELQHSQTMESRCARILGEYLNAALLVAHDPLCRLVDYKDISLNKALEIAKFFNVATRNNVDMSALEATLSTYSKDPNAARLYSDDTLLKQESASNQLREEINVRARPFYERLLGQLH